MWTWGPYQVKYILWFIRTAFQVIIDESAWNNVEIRTGGAGGAFAIEFVKVLRDKCLKHSYFSKALPRDKLWAFCTE